MSLTSKPGVRRSPPSLAAPVAAGDLAERPQHRAAGQAGAGRVVVEVVGVRPLPVVDVRRLRRVDRLRRAVHVAAGQAQVRAPLLVPEAVHALDAPGVGLVVQRQLGAVDRAVDRGQRRAYRGAAAAHVLAHARHRVVGERLEDDALGVGRAAALGRDDGVLLTGDGVEHADRPAAGGLAAELGRAVDGGDVRRGDVVPVVVRIGVRRRADAAGVEHRLDRTATVSLAERVAEHVGPLDEEGPLLDEEDLARAQVDLRRIRLDLAEVRVDGARQGEARAQAVLEIEPEPGDRVAAVEHRIGVVGRVQLGAADRVGQELEPPGRSDAADAGHAAEHADLLHHVLGPRRPGAELLVAVDAAQYL